MGETADAAILVEGERPSTAWSLTVMRTQRETLVQVNAPGTA